MHRATHSDSRARHVYKLKLSSPRNSRARPTSLKCNLTSGAKRISYGYNFPLKFTTYISLHILFIFVLQTPKPTCPKPSDPQFPNPNRLILTMPAIVSIKPEAARSNGVSTPQKRRLRSDTAAAAQDTLISTPVKWKSPRTCTTASPNTPLTVSSSILLLDYIQRLAVYIA